MTTFPLFVALVQDATTPKVGLTTCFILIQTHLQGLPHLRNLQGPKGCPVFWGPLAIPVPASWNISHQISFLIALDRVLRAAIVKYSVSAPEPGTMSDITLAAP